MGPLCQEVCVIVMRINNPRLGGSIGFLFGFLILFSQPSMARGRTKPIQSASPTASVKVFEIDNFKDGNLTRSPRWTPFGGIKAMVEPNDQSDEPAYLGRYSLHLSGKGVGNFVGGLSVYLPMDLSIYTGLQLTIYSRTKQSGRLRIELYDDDNGNCMIEPNPYYRGYTLFDDRFVTEIPVNWRGWHTVTIPFFQFFDHNPGVGDDKWNPIQQKGSCGLVQLQLILNAEKKGGDASIRIDNIRLIQGDLPPSTWVKGGTAEVLDAPYFETLDGQP